MRYHFDKRPGQNAGIAKESDESEGVLIYAEVPDTVRLPPELGGQEVCVLRAYARLCPGRCGAEVKCYELEGGIHVAECTSEGFLWFKPRKPA